MITGSRDGRRDAISKLEFIALSKGNPQLVVVGDATGVDSQVKRWAEGLGITVQVFEADWEQYGKVAGPVRNHKMVSYVATCRDSGEEVSCFAFPGRNPGGTQDCFDRAVAAGIKSYMFRWVTGIS